MKIRRVAPTEAHELARQLAALLIDCVEGGASVGFMLPISPETALAFWQRVADGVLAGERVLLVAEDDDGIVGTVQLVLSLPQNQPHRGDVVKMLVARRARRQGVAMQLLEALDREALTQGRTVLVLDAVTGGDAERLYTRAGWQTAGSVPKYALMPVGGYCATTFMYKHLQPGAAPTPA